MNFYEHLFLSSITAPLAVIATVPTDVLEPSSFVASFLFALAAFLFAVAAGTLIDLDHFLIMRGETGDWRDLRKAIRDPRGAMTDFRTLTVYSAEKKYAGHLVSGPIALGVVYLVFPEFLALAAAMIGLHIASDLAASAQKQEFPFGDADPGTERATLL